ncbi:MAG TPA: hypothetical protein VNT01_14980 [Symbiobacteriaceae bacterium]|nr:hypothetical protein [Symbiobacteriaceae bacterium]
MGNGATLTFRLPEGWTLRKVANVLAREWIPPFRAEPVHKAARWVVQPVVDDPGAANSPLWEPGISTDEYEARLDRSDLAWSIRASAGRGKSTILARLSMNEEQPGTFDMVVTEGAFPPALFDPEKLDEFLKDQGAAETEGLFAALLTSHGIEPAQM